MWMNIQSVYPDWLLVSSQMKPFLCSVSWLPALAPRVEAASCWDKGLGDRCVPCGICLRWPGWLAVVMCLGLIRGYRAVSKSRFSAFYFIPLPGPSLEAAAPQHILAEWLKEAAHIWLLTKPKWGGGPRTGRGRGNGAASFQGCPGETARKQTGSYPCLDFLKSKRNPWAGARPLFETSSLGRWLPVGRAQRTQSLGRTLSAGNPGAAAERVRAWADGKQVPSHLWLQPPRDRRLKQPWFTGWRWLASPV